MAKSRRLDAIARGAALLHLMRMEAVETAMMLANIARLGGKDGPSLKVHHG